MVSPDSFAGFLYLTDGTILVRGDDGAFRGVPSETGATRLAALTEAEIERHAATDPDHPALDEAFWAGPDTTRLVRLDPDVHAYFHAGGDDYQGRVNAALRKAIGEPAG